LRECESGFWHDPLAGARVYFTYFMEKLNDKWVRIGGLALLLLNLFIMDSGGSPRETSDEVLYISLYIVSVALILESGRFIILRLHKKFPESSNSRKRFLWGSSFVFVSNLVLIPATFYGSHLIRGINHVGHSAAFFFAIIVSSMILALIQTGIYEGYYYHTRLRKVEMEKEELVRINLQGQLDSLKQQVNPHFLFNNMNTISSLIDKDPEKAKRYLAEMSKVYRYLLRANEMELATLQSELIFLDSYFHLLKARFQEGLFLSISVDERFNDYRLPGLTLQLLVENAVKHNRIDKINPLTIEIGTMENEWLSVKNNLQKRVSVIPSTRIGLANIMAKYKLLNQPDVIIREEQNEFIVLLPLIKNGIP
jgi:two-component system, LytTR family, sensor kinase